MNSSFNIRFMTEDDLKLVHKWRNHENIRKASGANTRFTVKQHRHWFDCSTSLDKFIFEEDGVSAGVVLYDKVSKYWSFYLNPLLEQNTGLGTIMLILAQKIIKKNGYSLIRSAVNTNNVNSISVHYKLNFDFIKTENDQFQYEKELK